MPLLINPLRSPLNPVFGRDEIDIDFLSTGTLSADIFTSSRSTSATAFDNTGTRQNLGSNVMRFDHNPSNLQPRGLLLEGPRTPYLANNTVPANQTTGSLGSGTYVLWMEGTGSVAVAAGTATGSGFGSATASSPVVFTISGAGTVTVTITGTVTAFQIENGGFASSLVVTGASPAARGVDVCYSTKLASLFAAGRGTLVAEVEIMGTPAASTFPRNIAVTDGSNNNNIYVYMNRSNGRFYAGSRVAGSGTSDVNSGVNYSTGMFKIGLTWESGRIATSINGSTAATAVPSSLAVPSRLDFNFNYFSTYPFQWWRRLKAINDSVTNDELKSLTA